MKIINSDSNYEINENILNINNSINIFIELEKEEKIDINISDASDVIINIIGVNSKSVINYNLTNTSVIINSLVKDNSNNVNLNLSYNSNIIYNYSSINKEKQKYVININHLDSYSNAYVYNHGLNIGDDKTIFDVNTIIPKKSSNCISNQDNKIIYLKKNFNEINPNLFIDNSDVEANHAAYIGTFNKDNIFYMMNRGITKENCFYLLKKSFLLNKMVLTDEVYKYFEDFIEEVKIYE